MKTTLMLMLFIVFGCVAPHAPAASTPPDEKAFKLLQEAVKTYANMQTISGDFVVRQHVVGHPANEMSGTFKAQKPNRYRIDAGGAIPLRFVSDGKNVLMVFNQQNAYSLMPFDDLAMNQTVTAVAPLTLFFNQHKLVAPGTPTRYVAREKWNGAEYDVVEQTLGRTTMRYYVGADHIVSRMKVHLEQGGQVADVDAFVTHVRFDAPMKQSDFPVDAPQGARLVNIPRPGGNPVLAGSGAPAFSLPSPDGGDVSLSGLLRGRKAVLVTFWFYACATCREEFPQLMKLYAEYKPRGLEIVAIDSFDESPTISKYVKEAGITCPVGMDDAGSRHFGIAKKYGVAVYPTAYLIGGDGKVVARFVGYKEDELRAALQKMGLGN